MICWKTHEVGSQTSFSTGKREVISFLWLFLCTGRKPTLNLDTYEPATVVCVQNRQSTEACRKVASRVPSCHGSKPEDRIRLAEWAAGTKDESRHHALFVDISSDAIAKKSELLSTPMRTHLFSSVSHTTHKTNIVISRRKQTPAQS